MGMVIVVFGHGVHVVVNGSVVLSSIKYGRVVEKEACEQCSLLSLLSMVDWLENAVES